MQQRPCPSIQELLLRATDGPLSADAEAHLAAGCADCVRRQQILDALLRVASAPAWPEVPDAWRLRATAIPERPAKPGKGPTETIRDLVARLIHEVGGGAPTPAIALRGPGPSERHYLYAAGPFEIDLAHLDSGALVGQVLASDGDATPLESGVCVLYGERTARESRLEPSGDFHFDAVRPGDYDLFLETPAVRVFLHDLRLAAGEDEG